MATTLDDILDDKDPAPPPAAEPADKDAPSEPSTEAAPAERSKRAEHRRKEFEAQGRDPDTGKFKAKDKPEAEAKAEPAKEPAKAPEKAQEKPAAPAQPEMSARERALLAAAEDERGKRQALERRLAEVGKQTDKPATETEKKFWDDPEGHLKSAEQRQQAIVIQGVLRTSEILARSRYQDFDEKIAVFRDVMAKNPTLTQEWLAAADPAEYAYRLGKNHQDLRQAGNLDKLRADIEAKARAEERAKVEAEYKAKQEEADRKRAELPRSLSDVRGASTNKTTAAWAGPTSLSDILK